MHRGRPTGESFDHCPPGWIRQSRKCSIQTINNHMVVDTRSMSSANFAIPDFCSLKGWGDFIGFDTEFTIDRTEFGVNGGSSWSAILGKEVEIHLSVGAFREGDK